MTKLLITGRSGRMGETLIEAGNENPDTQVTSTHDTGDDLTAAFQDVDAAIDFTVHHFTGDVLDAAIASNTPLIIGTTGHTDEERARIVAAAETLPIVFAPNLSLIHI